MFDLELTSNVDIKESHDEETMCATHLGVKWIDCACDKKHHSYNPVKDWFDVDSEE